MYRQASPLLSSLLPLAAALLFSLGCGQPQPPVPASGTETSELLTGGWKVIGPGGGGGIFKPTISPHDPDLMLTHCDMTGAYVSADGGDSWRMFYTGNVPSAFEFDPVDPNVIYVASRGFLWSEDRGSGVTFLLRSSDRGVTWKIVYPDVSKVDPSLDLPQSREILPSQVIEGAVDGTIQEVEVDPADNRRIFLGMAPLVEYMSRGDQAPSRQAALVVSEDGGNSWRQVAELPGMSVLGIFPGSNDGKPGEALVFTERSGALVDIGKGTVTTLPLPVERISAAEGGMDAGGTVIYVLSGLSRREGEERGGAFVSRDRGQSWKRVSAGLFHGVPEGESPNIRGLAVCETAPGTAYLSSSNTRSVRDVEGAWYYGIFKTVNYGESWEPVWLADGEGYLTGNHEGCWLDRHWGPGWGGNPIDIGIDPNNPDLVFGSDNGRAYRSRDGGKNWKQIHSRNNPDGSVETSGLNVTTCYGVIFDPFDENHFFITYTDIGLFHTFDGGKSWFHSIDGVPMPWTNTCYWLTFDPQVRGRAWAVWANAHDLPRDKMFGRDGRFTRYQGGVSVTEDGGRSWRVAGTGVPENAVSTCVLVDPDSPREKRTLYITVYDQGVYKSEDGGATWKLANNGLGSNLYAWRIERNRAGRLFVLMSRGRRGPETDPGVIFYSDDRAESWKKLALPPEVQAPHDIAIDPRDDSRIYVACWSSQGRDGVDIGGGLIRSDDGGANWKQVFDARMRINSLALHPHDPDIVFINTFQNAAFRSDDRGENWSRLEGYRFKWGQRPNISPFNPDKVYLTTYGGSVFEGPAAGVPGASEDIVNMPGAWW